MESLQQARGAMVKAYPSETSRGEVYLITGDKGKGTEAYDGQGEPDDAETVLFPRGDQRVNDAG